MSPDPQVTPRLLSLLEEELAWADFNDEWSLRCSGARFSKRELMIRITATSAESTREKEVRLCTFPAHRDDAHLTRIEQGLRVALVRCRSDWMKHVSPGLSATELMRGDAMPQSGDPLEPFAHFAKPVSKHLAEVA